jgi:transposase
LDSAPAKSTVEEWFAKLKRGEMCIEGDARSGRPKKAVSDENFQKVHIIILNDRMKFIEIAETLKISKKSVEHIVHEKLCTKWLPRLLKIDQNQQRFEIRSNVKRYSTVIKTYFSVNILQWM